MKTNFGNVYVTERKISADGKESITSKLQESVFFCNIDHKWYDSERNLSSLYDEYKGRSWSVQFKVNQPDKNGKEVELEGKIRMPYKLGEVAHQDFESVPEAIEHTRELWRSRGVLSEDKNDDDYHMLENLQSEVMIAAFYPGRKILECRAFLSTIDPFVILDEHMDKGSSQKDTPFHLSRPYWLTYSDIIEGKKVGFEDGSEQNKPVKLPVQYVKMLASMHEFRKVLAAREEEASYLIQSYKDFNDALSLENSLEWKQKQEDSTSLIYKTLEQELRLITIAAPITVELLLFDQGIQIEKEIRESFLFKSIIKVISQHCYLVNDLMSLKKEMAQGSTSNIVFLFHDREGLSMEDAFQKTIDRINSLTKEIQEIGELFVNLFGEQAKQVVTVIKNIMNGSIQWHGITTRYHSNMIYDCVIELE